jgi:hypothetical protein
MTKEGFAKLRETAEAQLRAEADGGYAAGDGPSYDADEIVAALDALDEIRAFVEKGANEGRNLIPEADDEQAWAIESVCAAIDGMLP